MKYKIKNLFYAVDTFFRPRQKWLTKKIPKTWCDKVELLPLLMFEILIRFVEEENGIAQLHLDWTEDVEKGFVSQEYVDNIKSIYSELEKTYYYVKTERKTLESALDKAYSDVPIWPNIASLKSYNEVYSEVIRIEKEIEEKDFAAMYTIVKHHQVLWT